jgi:hypothetical protein
VSAFTSVVGPEPPRLLSFLRTVDPSTYTIVYTAGVREQYHFEEDGYDAVAAAGTDVVSVRCCTVGPCTASTWGARV